MANNYEAPEEDMAVTITLEDDTEVLCNVVTVLEVNGQNYIVLLPDDDGVRFPEDEVWIYRLKENPDDPNEEPELEYIDDEDEYEAASDAFDEYLDNLDFFEED